VVQKGPRERKPGPNATEMLSSRSRSGCSFGGWWPFSGQAFTSLLLAQFQRRTLPSALTYSGSKVALISGEAASLTSRVCPSRVSISAINDGCADPNCPASRCVDLHHHTRHLSNSLRCARTRCKPRANASAGSLNLRDVVSSLPRVIFDSTSNLPIRLS